MHRRMFTFVVFRIEIWDNRDVVFSDKTTFYLTGTLGTSGIAYGNVFTLVVKRIRSRIVTEFIDS